MDVAKLKRTEGYYFQCDLKKRDTLKGIANTNCFDVWGIAFVSLGEEIGVEYNLCIDNTTNEHIDCSAIYKVDYNEKNDCIEIDTGVYIHYEIDFNNPKWKRELENAMCRALIEFFGL